MCDAFAELGFAATHVGGNDAPDGYVDAKLGPLGYRAMLECKTSAKPMQRPDIYEASRWRDAYQAQYAALVGPSFGDTAAIADEVKAHGVALWSVDDLAAVLALPSDAWEMRTLFEPGIVEDKLRDLQWEREHGIGKRIAVLCDILRQEGWAVQESSVAFDAPSDAPRLTEESALLLADAHLRNLGSHVPCRRDEIASAFAYLTSARVADAVWVDDARSAIVMRRPPPRPLTPKELASQRWFGYGHWDAPYWFIGKEPGGADDPKTYDAWLALGGAELVDCHALDLAWGGPDGMMYHAPGAPVQQTWRPLIALLLAVLQAESTYDLEAIRKYQIERWGRDGGETAVLELSAVNALTTAHREALRLANVDARIDLLRARLAAHKPKLVVFYGVTGLANGGSYLDYWNRIAGHELTLGEPLIDRGTVFVATKHPTSYGMSND